jgi:glucosylceramidase
MKIVTQLFASLLIPFVTANTAFATPDPATTDPQSGLLRWEQSDTFHEQDNKGGDTATSLTDAKSYGSRARMWVTTGDQAKKFAYVGSSQVVNNNPGDAVTIRVDASVMYQEMEGFGAALTDSSAWLIQNKLSDAQRKRLMKHLFDKDDGIGLSYLRMPLGSSDFTAQAQHYTYGDTCCDLTNFSIEKDKAYILPVARMAKHINKDLRFMGSPWSAPAWMKDSASLFMGKLKYDNFAVYADYLRKTADAYAQAGVPLSIMTIQNEPRFEPGTYPGMFFEWYDELNFVRVLGPKMAGSGVKLLSLDHNWDYPWYPKASMGANEAGREYYAGSAWHCYGGDPSAMTDVHNSIPDKDIYFTECSGFYKFSNFSDNLKYAGENLIIGGPRNWAKTVLFWNLALDPNGAPHLGGCQDCRGVVTIDQTNGSVKYNEEFYALAHISKFVRPGARRIESNNPTADILSVAFRNANGGLVAVVLNKNNSAQDVRLEQSGQSFKFTLPPASLATFTW